ncbi:NEL-type E3 ubiquitin ligase domain-containing protein [Escherichia fergusonii]|uniref:NEL-type E3 ubiquitin ligase domain-containing protein n=1 Tax=Escherichia fergusonii TaxID=564 RepID=UPI0015D9475E|nr:NEL-type E3 ubiquitin ligase domain-containing protein [Escherichia fergusonii]
MTGTGIPDTYQTPDFDDGSLLILDLSVAGQATLTAYATGKTPAHLTLTPVHPAWADVCNGPVHATLIHEWCNWAATSAPGERRDEALRRVTECVVRGDTELHLDKLKLSSLPTLPPLLTKLAARKNQLTELPTLPLSLKELDIGNNRLTRLPDQLPSLTMLSVVSNRLTSLPDLPPSLTRLYAWANSLTRLPDLPPSLTTLYASNNQLTALPVLPPSLTRLDAWSNSMTRLPDLPPSLTTLDISRNQLTSLPDLPFSLTRLDAWSNSMTALPDLPPSLTTLDISGNQLTRLPSLPASLQGQDVGFSRQRTVSSTLASAIIPWYPEERQGTVRTAWTSRVAEENAVAFTTFLTRLNENPCARLPEFRARVAAWLDELLITPELCTFSFAIAQEASTSCTDRAALGWNNMQVARLLFHAVCNEQTTVDAFITLARQIFRLRETERIAGEKVRLLTAAKKNVDEIEVYLAYQIQLKIPLGLPDCLAPQMLFGRLAAVTPEDISIAAEDVRLAEEGEFGNWLNNWAPCQQFLLKRMSEDEREALTEQRTAVYSEKLEELRLEFSEAGSGTDVDRVLGVRATEATNNAIFGPLAELAFFMPT